MKIIFTSLLCLEQNQEECTYNNYLFDMLSFATNTMASKSLIFYNGNISNDTKVSDSTYLEFAENSQEMRNIIEEFKQVLGNNKILSTLSIAMQSKTLIDLFKKHNLINQQEYDIWDKKINLWYLG